MCVEFGPMRTHKEVFGRLLELRTQIDSVWRILAVVFCLYVSIMFDLLLLVARCQGACRRFH